MHQLASPIVESIPDNSINNRIFFPYLDSLRALAALYIVHEHILYYVLTDNASNPLLKVLEATRFGHYAVVLFIVLSGYCLALPVMRRRGELGTNFQTYITRRARRILPPYYACLVFSGLVIVFRGVTTHKWGEAFDLAAWTSHLLLIHNLVPKEAYSLNGVLWSIATEWHIYFFFPLFLLPIWKKWGSLVTVLNGLAMGMALFLMFPAISLACPWFIGLFAMGIMAADLHFNPSRTCNAHNKPYLLLAALTGISGLAIATLLPQLHWKNAVGFEALMAVPLDIWMGLSAFFLITGLTQAKLRGNGSLILKLLEWPPLPKIGAFSYSIYLIHMPVLGMINWAAKKIGLTFPMQYIFLLVIGLFLSLSIAYVFYLLFERPFLSSPRQKSVEELPPSGGVINV